MYKDSNEYPREKCFDVGPNPYVGDIAAHCRENRNFRTALWTGDYLQMTLMSIPMNGEIGTEKHTGNDQYLQVVSGQALVLMGKSRNDYNYRKKAGEGYGIFVPVETWHNVINIGDKPLKLISIYAPPQHPHGVVERTKAEADANEKPTEGWKFR